MPKKWAMAQISRPFQIALIAVGLLVAVWFVALRGHSPSQSGPAAGAAPASTSAPAATAHASIVPAHSPAVSAAGEEKAAAAPTPIYHGAAPGVEGLTRDINKAHGAVATSQQHAKQFERQSAESSSASAPAASATTTPVVTASTPAASSSSSPVTKVSSTTVAKAPAKAGSKVASTTTAAALHSGEKAVQAELKHGDVVVLLFWNPAGADDVAVRNALRPLASAHRKIVVHEAPAKEVASFGSITRGVQVDQTPTVLIVTKTGVVTPLSGLTDTYSVEQAIEEALRA